MKTEVKKEDILLETERLSLRIMGAQDLENLYPLLSDPEVMRYYPKTLSRQETREWLDHILTSYDQHGLGWWAVHLKYDQSFIGQVGLLMQQVDKSETPGLGYMTHKKYWRLGYTLEAAQAVIRYGFQELQLQHLICLVRPENVPSNQLAQKLGFKAERTVHFKGFKHYLYRKLSGSQPSTF